MSSSDQQPAQRERQHLPQHVSVTRQPRNEAILALRARRDGKRGIWWSDEGMEGLLPLLFGRSWEGTVSSVVGMIVEDADGTTEESLRELAAEYWYNLAGLILIIYVSAFVTQFLISYGTKRGWAHYNDVHISQFTQISVPVPALRGSRREHGWKLLLAYRIAVLLFCIFVWLWTLFYDGGGNLWSFASFYTIWNFTMLIAYFAVSSLLFPHPLPLDTM